MKNQDASSYLSPWAMNISPSPTLVINAKARALKAQGMAILDFGAGEPNFDTPEFIKEACKQALDSGKTKYIAAEGLPELREALAEKYRSVYGISGIQSSQIIVSPGGKFSCYIAILATCSPGDEVIIPAPYWVSYPEMVKLSGATPKIVETNAQSNLKITPDQLKKAISPRTKLLIINSPSNPSGVIYSKEELLAILKICLSHNILILSDEIYEDLTYDGAEHHCIAALTPEAKNHVMVASGFSKTYSMTGWRLGTLLAPEAIAKAAANIQSQTVSNATTFAQWGALAAYQNPEATQRSLNMMLEAFARRRKQMLEGLNKIQGITTIPSQGAFYLFPNIEHYGLSSSDCATRLLEDGLAVIPGIAFGSEGYLRLSFATSDAVIAEGLQKLKNFFQAL